MVQPIDGEKTSSVEAAKKIIKKDKITEEEAKTLMQAFFETKEYGHYEPVNLTILERNRENMSKEIYKKHIQPMIDKVFKEFYPDAAKIEYGPHEPVNLTILERTKENMSKAIHEKYIQPLIDKEFEKYNKQNQDKKD